LGADAASAAGAKPASDYDTFVDWPKRLGREAPLFRAQFATHGVRRVVDVGCGSGMHAIMWAKWGLDVIGVDPDPSMLAQAEINHSAALSDVEAAGGSVVFVAAGFGGLQRLGVECFDAVTCTGNALPHVKGAEGLREALADFAAALRPGGVLVLHLLNHDRLISGSIRSIAPVVRDTADGTQVFLRVIDYEPGAILFDFVTMHRPKGALESGAPWEIASRRSTHAALPGSLLLPALAEAGFADVVRFGSHDGAAFDVDRDESVIIVATRR
jgi:SAM-dependent methyltransferase